MSFMKIPLVSSSLDQKEQKCFGHPKFYSSNTSMHPPTLLPPTPITANPPMWHLGATPLQNKTKSLLDAIIKSFCNVLDKPVFITN